MEAAISSKKQHQATALKHVPLAWEMQGELEPQQNFDSEAAREKENHKNVKPPNCDALFRRYIRNSSEGT